MLIEQGQIRGGGGGGGGGTGGPDPPPPPPLEFWQRSGYQIRDWDRFDIAQHLCKLVINLKKVQNVETSWLELETLTFLVYGLHPLKSGNQKYHIIRRVRFRWETPL